MLRTAWKNLKYPQTNSWVLFFCSVFKKLLPSNVFVSTQATKGVPLELGHCGHGNKRTFLKLSGMEISGHVIAFLRGAVWEGQSTTPSGFWDLGNVSSSSLHLWPNPLSSTHPFFKWGLLFHFSMSSLIFCPENLADSLRLRWNVTGNVIQTKLITSPRIY